MDNNSFDLNNLEIEPLSDEALDLATGGDSSSGAVCCSCSNCSNAPKPAPDPAPIEFLA